MSDAALAQFKELTKNWPKPEDEKAETAPEKKPEEPKKDPLADLSEREREIVQAVMDNLDFTRLLIEDTIEADIPLREDLVLRFRSPRANAPFKYQEYVAHKRSQSARAIEDALDKNAPPPPPWSETPNHRVVWSLASGLVSINGQAFIPGSGEGHTSSKMDRLLEKSKHVLDQFIWAQNLFDFALRVVCDSDGGKLGEKLKNS
jgi:hypothetical protein